MEIPLMSDHSKEKNNDNPSKIREILADFFLKKIDMPFASENSDHHLHKSKKKKSKHKKRKHKKHKHRNRSYSSDSTSELNIKGVDDVSSSEEMGIKRLKKIKNIKVQSINSLVQSVSETKNIQSNSSPDKKPVFYGPSLELLLTGVDSNSDIVSSCNLSLKDLSSSDKKTFENETKTDLKETNSFQENLNYILFKEDDNAKSSNVSLECPGVNSSSKKSCDNDNVENSPHSATAILSDFKNQKEDNFKSNVKKNEPQIILEVEDSKINLNSKACTVIGKKDELKHNIIKDNLIIETEDGDSGKSKNENNYKTYIEENNLVSDIKEKSSDNTEEINLDCEYAKSDNSKILPPVNEMDKNESKEDYMNSNSENNEKQKSDINYKKDANNHYISVIKKSDNKSKHSRSHSRSASPTKCTSSKLKHRNQRSRSSSHDSYHSKKKKKERSRSRSYSHEKTRSRRSYSRSYSRSRSRSRHQKSRRRSNSQSPHKRFSHKRSRSRSNIRSKKSSRLRTQRRSKSREYHYSSSNYNDRSRARRRLSHSRSRSRSKSQHKSPSPKESHSRIKSKEKKSSSEKNNKIDQAKILETARRNVLQMIKKGTLPEGLPIEKLKKEQLLSIQAGGKSVQELTDFCQRLSQKENEEETSDNEEKDDKADDVTGFIHHPFKVKEPGVIKLNIKNAVQLPIKTHAQKVAETARLSSQFPVSSGNKHKQKELEWIPVVPESSRTETKSTVTTVSTVSESSSAIACVPVESTVLSVPPPPPVPIAYSCPPPTEVMPVATATSMPNMLPSTVPMPPSIPLPPLPPIVQPTTVYQPLQPMIPSYAVANQQIIFPTLSTTAPSTSVFKPPKKLDISSIVTKRFQALQKLNENPNDIEALRVLQEAQESIQDWVESQQVPGLFTGSTDVKLLTVDELSGPFKHRNRKKIVIFIT